METWKKNRGKKTCGPNLKKEQRKNGRKKKTTERRTAETQNGVTDGKEREQE